MLIIIDAYNLLKQINSQLPKSGWTRDHFIKTIVHYVKKKGHEGLMVFDGGDSRWIQQHRVGLVIIVYPGIGVTADDYIIQVLKKHTQPDIVLLVSTDRALNAVAHAKNIATIDSYDFYIVLKEAMEKREDLLKKQDTIIQFSTPNSDLDAMMHEGAKKIIGSKDKVINSTCPVSVGKKMNKAERRLMKKLQKL